MWKTTRNSGILLHITSLPGRYGMGDLGPEAYRFADMLQQTGQSIWQVLPLGPTSYGDSPYQSPSTFAGNHFLISYELLHADGLLSDKQFAALPDVPQGPIDYGAVIQDRNRVLQQVCRTFKRLAPEDMLGRYEAFCEHNAYWLDDYALFMAIKEQQGGGAFIDWPQELIQREVHAMKAAARNCRTAVRNTKIMQFLFHDQWMRLRAYCNERGIDIMGDIPIFVAHDSADVWAHPELFFVNRENGELEFQAGVPPDYFSATGQLWGNPLYRWDVHRETNFVWWGDRIQKIFEMVDMVRIDHFRGFEACWEVPAHADNAIGGHWEKGGGEDLFNSLQRRFGELKIVAEDLGIITEEVDALRDQFELPGMRVLQFAFGNDAKAEEYRPHNYPENCVTYTGTHDNDTTVSWFNSQAGEGSTRTSEEVAQERQTILDYLGTRGDEIEWDMISLAFHSKANTAIVPMQDVLGLGPEGRMNNPGVAGGNWQWRFAWDTVPEERLTRLRDIAASGNRFKNQQE